MGTISLRKHIRWLPGEASEPTSTLVLTSPQKRFVDLRILKGQHSSSDLTLSRLDWAIAGTTSSSTRDDGRGGRVAHSQFYHWIDSQSTDPAMDEGDMLPQPDGTTLEVGTMVNPATGLDTAYEELWLDAEPGPGAAECVVLEMEVDWNGGKGRRGMVVRLGPWCQGFSRDGDGLTLERWELEEGEWRRRVRMGAGVLPCSAVLGTGFKARVGDAVMEIWKVVEVMG